MFLGPLHRVSHPNVPFIIQRFLRRPLKLSQQFTFAFGQLRVPQRLQFVPAQILLFPRPFRGRQLFTQILEIPGGQFRLFLEQFCQRFINLGVSLGEPVA